MELNESSQLKTLDLTISNEFISKVHKELKLKNDFNFIESTWKNMIDGIDSNSSAVAFIKSKDSLAVLVHNRVRSLPSIQCLVFKDGNIEELNDMIVIKEKFYKKSNKYFISSNGRQYPSDKNYIYDFYDKLVDENKEKLNKYLDFYYKKLEKRFYKHFNSFNLDGTIDAITDILKRNNNKFDLTHLTYFSEISRLLKELEIVKNKKYNRQLLFNYIFSHPDILNFLNIKNHERNYLSDYVQYDNVRYVITNEQLKYLLDIFGEKDLIDIVLKAIYLDKINNPTLHAISKSEEYGLFESKIMNFKNYKLNQ